ncbi:hypothetical protein [Variovorax sp. GT1P44]|uniref:hypothetical protein n=1 Tax=Variovorax sp. GT1P44 TaxID=3443742 RepID=UPI003F473347
MPSAVNIPPGPETIRLDEMKQTSIDIALLENALATIERVLAHADSELHGTPYHGPTANVPLEAVRTEDQRFRASAAQSAINICLSSAAALVDVSQALMSKPVDRAPDELERDWQALITHTKIASRSAYRAALVMAAQKNVLAAQGLAPAEAKELPIVTH